MLIKFNCVNCDKIVFANVYHKHDETITKWYYICPCNMCATDNVVAIYKPLQLQLFPTTKGEQSHDV